MKILSFENQVLRSVFICFCVLIVHDGVARGAKSNAPEEITELFKGENEASDAKNITMPVGIMENVNKIFAEGSSGTVSMTPTESRSNGINNFTSIVVSKKSNKTDSLQLFNETTQKNVKYNKDETIVSKSLFDADSNNKTVLQVFNNTTLDFIPDVDTLVHASGTSSIKPRKGVTYSKTVPKKGVDIEDFLNYNFPLNRSCFILDPNTCYNVVQYKNLECTCCNSSNNLGDLISHQPLINCTTCLPINKLPTTFSQPCSGICCKNITQNIKGKSNAYTKFDNGNITSSNTSYINNGYEVFETEENTYNKVLDKTNVNAGKTLVLNSLKKPKLKPSVTKVPYDSDRNNSFSKSKGEKYVPIIVSIFILPLVGVFLFLMWKKTRELWDRRYYKKMDFLIDGMYNDSY